MAIKLTTSREAAQHGGIKALVYGPAGSGKTWLARTTGAPTVIISAEAGLLSLRDVDIPVIEVNTIADVRDAYKLLKGEQGAEFKWIMLDSISEIAEVVLSDEKSKTKDPRQAYGALIDEMGQLVRAFRDLPKNILMTAKVERVKDDLAGGLFYSPAMPGQRVGQQLPYFFDEVFALRVEKDDQGNPVRWLQTQPDPQYIAKDRSGALEPFEPADLSAIANKILRPASANQ